MFPASVDWPYAYITGAFAESSVLDITRKIYHFRLINDLLPIVSAFFKMSNPMEFSRALESKDVFSP